MAERFYLIFEVAVDCEWDLFPNGVNCDRPAIYSIVDSENTSDPDHPKGFHAAHLCEQHALSGLQAMRLEHANPADTAFSIPVMFTVHADTEIHAAEKLRDALVVNFNHLFSGETADIFEDWWMPNHPSVDGNDINIRVMWEPQNYVKRSVQS